MVKAKRIKDPNKTQLHVAARIEHISLTQKNLKQTCKTRTEKQLLSTAMHESGHAVLAVLERMPFKSVPSSQMRVPWGIFLTRGHNMQCSTGPPGIGSVPGNILKLISVWVLVDRWPNRCTPTLSSKSLSKMALMNFARLKRQVSRMTAKSGVTFAHGSTNCASGCSRFCKDQMCGQRLNWLRRN